MTLLAAPTLVSQLQGEPHEWDCCGQACVTSVLLDSRVTVTLAQVVAKSMANGWCDDAGETTPDDLVALLASYGVPAHATSGLPLAANVSLALGHESICLVRTNTDGVPTAGETIGHWLLSYGNVRGYQFEQPLGPVPGSLLDLAASQFAAVQLNDAVAIDVVLPKDQLRAGVTYKTPNGSLMSVDQKEAV